MAIATSRRFFLSLGTSLLLCVPLSYAQIASSVFAKLEALRLTPELAGTLIYRGETFSQDTTSTMPLYRYERRVLSSSYGLTATHMTSDLAGRVIIAESAVVSPGYALERLEVLNQQSGFAGSVRVSKDGHRLDYELDLNGAVSTASEVVSDPVVSGPSMFGFILKNWDALKAGTIIPVRMIVLKEKTTYGFDIKFAKQINARASFTITPSNFLIRMAVAPLRLVFDANTKSPIQYIGRVPPMESLAGKLKDLDARVEYSLVAPAYR
jgi:hypothetical protein